MSTAQVQNGKQNSPNGIGSYAVSYSILITIIPHQHIDMRNPYFPISGWKVCWEGIPISYS
ncbi:hypothetical protein CBJ87_004035 [Salmonella enterica subsp. enterica serovar Fresno]|nr:hypothetical protein [Salmonella enterica subsp. enterica serovar Fresno]